MARLHARVTLEIEISDEELHRIVKENINERGYVHDYDLTVEDVERFLKTGKIDPDWGDLGYIPDNWLMFDAVDSGLYDGDEDGLRRKENT